MFFKSFYGRFIKYQVKILKLLLNKTEYPRLDPGIHKKIKTDISGKIVETHSKFILQAYIKLLNSSVFPRSLNL